LLDAAVADREVLAPDRRTGALCALESEREIGGQAFARHAEHAELGMPRRRLEIRPGPAAELHDVELLVDEHACRCIAREQHVVDVALHVERGPRGIGDAPPR